MVASGGSGSFLEHVQHVLGGALEQMSIFALGIMPYVSASIVIQLLTVVVPKLDQLNKEGRAGRQEDQPVHPLRHHHAGGRPGLLHRDLARGPERRQRADRH
jgi:hypothetical protein